MCQNKTVLIINPGSGKKKAQGIIQYFNNKVNNRFDYDLIISQSENHLKEIAVKCFNEYVNIILAGGDTTFTIVINSILNNLFCKITDTKDLRRLIAGKSFGILAQGSANDISKELNTHKIDYIIDAVINNRTEKMDLGLLNTGNDVVYFLGSVSLGLGILVNQYLEKFKKNYPRLSGNLFLRNTIMGIYYIFKSFSNKEIPKTYTIHHQKKVYKESISLLLFQNCATYAGGVQFFQECSLFNGYLTCIIIRTKTFFKTLKILPYVLRKKSYKRREIKKVTGLSFKLVSDEPITLQYDGEIIKGKEMVEISLIDSILTVFRK